MGSGPGSRDVRVLLEAVARCGRRRWAWESGSGSVSRKPFLSPVKAERCVLRLGARLGRLDRRREPRDVRVDEVVRVGEGVPRERLAQQLRARLAAALVAGLAVVVGDLEPPVAHGAVLVLAEQVLDHRRLVLGDAVVHLDERGRPKAEQRKGGQVLLPRRLVHVHEQRAVGVARERRDVRARGGHALVVDAEPEARVLKLGRVDRAQLGGEQLPERVGVGGQRLPRHVVVAVGRGGGHGRAWRGDAVARHVVL